MDNGQTVSDNRTLTPFSRVQGARREVWQQLAHDGQDLINTSLCFCPRVQLRTNRRELYMPPNQSQDMFCFQIAHL